MLRKKNSLLLLTTLLFAQSPMRIGRVEQHGGADAILPARTLQNIVVDTSIATPPEGFVIRQIGKGNRHITQFRIHLHDGCTRSQTEHLGFRPAHTGQLERHILDTFRNAKMTVFGMHDQSGGGDILLVAP